MKDKEAKIQLLSQEADEAIGKTKYGRISYKSSPSARSHQSSLRNFRSTTTLEDQHSLPRVTYLGDLIKNPDGTITSVDIPVTFLDNKSAVKANKTARKDFTRIQSSLRKRVRKVDPESFRIGPYEKVPVSLYSVKVSPKYTLEDFDSIKDTILNITQSIGWTNTGIVTFEEDKKDQVLALLDEKGIKYKKLGLKAQYRYK